MERKQVVTLTVYDVENRETRYTQVWAWVGPFDDAHATQAALVSALRNGGLHKLEFVETRTHHHPELTVDWEQETLF